MIGPEPKRLLRCAVYTRKSSDEGLEQAFNSLHAQREACEAYIVSQRHEGWLLVDKAYDDGGFSGGNLQRPALQQLLADVKAGQVDVVVVYKVDRLTRSLADFAKIVEILDDASGSFVSITQAFNTTTSMGRLTLNVLLSFAQFEREVTGERIRDKIAASKKKGMWMGGLPPLGYDAGGGQLVVNEAEAATVRKLFALYVQLGSVDALAAKAARLGIVSKLRQTAKGPRGGVPLSRGTLYHLLENPLYVGEVTHRGERHRGQHQAIVSQELFDSAQAMLTRRKVIRWTGEGMADPSLLVGLLEDAHGARFAPTHTRRRGRRYRYYVAEGAAGQRRLRIPARPLEEAVVSAAIGEISETSSLVALAESVQIPFALADARAREVAAALRGDSVEVRSTARTLLARVAYDGQTLEIALDLGAVFGQAQLKGHLHTIKAPARIRRTANDIRLIVGSQEARAPNPKLIELLARGTAWLEELVEGKVASLSTLATREGLSPEYVTDLVELSFLSPRLKTAIVQGAHSEKLNATTLRRLMPLPTRWEDQHSLWESEGLA